jgi:hypothetical protein
LFKGLIAWKTLSDRNDLKAFEIQFCF